MTQYVTMALADQHLAVDVMAVEDVLRPAALTPVPLAEDWVRGITNVRGQVVTVVDPAIRLGLSEAAEDELRARCVVVRHDGDVYGLLVDDVGDVTTRDEDAIESTPIALGSAWAPYTSEILRTDGIPHLILDVAALLGTTEGLA
ncbi:MAG: chemotaxis protein CheW [Pacificimonas sp.]